MTRLTLLTLLLTGCRWTDPGPTTPQQVANTYQPCEAPDGGTYQCLRSGETCGMYGECIETWASARRLPDAGTTRH